MCHESTSVALAEMIGIGKGSVHARGHPPRRADRGDRPEPGHQPPADAHRARGRQEERRDDPRDQPAAGGRLRPVPQPAERARCSAASAPPSPTCTCRSGSTATSRSSRRSARCCCEWDAVEPRTSSRSTPSGTTRGRRTWPSSTGPPSSGPPGSTATQIEAGRGHVPRRPAPRSLCWAMGITQHRNAVATIQEIINVALLQGNIGKPGAGLCPVRGHSNVQGDRTMGIWERPPQHFLDALQEEFGFDPPREDGLDTVASIRALRDGTAKVFFAHGRQLRRGRAGHPRHRGGDASRRPHRAGLDQAQPLPRGARRGGADPADARPHRAGPHRRRGQQRHRRGLDVGGARLARPAQAGQPAPALRGRHRLLAGRGRRSATGTACRGPSSAPTTRAIRAPDRRRRARLRGVRREGRPARRLRAAAPAARLADLPDRAGQGGVHGQPDRRAAGARGPAAAADAALARPVQHHDLRPRRPLPRRLRRPPGGVRAPRRHRRARARRGPGRRPGQRVDRRLGAARAGVPGGALRPAAGLRRVVLPRDQPAGPARLDRRWAATARPRSRSSCGWSHSPGAAAARAARRRAAADPTDAKSDVEPQQLS